MKPKTGYYRLMDQILQEDELAYRLFIESPPSPASRIVYWNDLKLYAQYRKVEAFEDLLKWDPRLLQSQIIDYIIYLKGQWLSSNSINTRINSIKKFYESNDIDLRWRKIKGYMGSKRRVKKDRPYTYEEIRKILEKANEWERVVIYLLISPGMRIGALNTLKIKHLQNIEQYNLYKITVYENEEEYTTFLYPRMQAGNRFLFTIQKITRWATKWGFSSY